MFWTKEKLKNLAVLGVSICLALLLGEIIIRVLTPKSVVSDPILGHKNTSDYGRDSLGFKNIKVLEQTQLLAIGDSQTEGNNATAMEAWPQVLGDLYNKSAYQMAVGGYGLIQYSVLLERALEKYDPELTIIGFYTGNDLLETVRLAYSNNNWSSLRRNSFTLTNTEDASIPEDARLMFQSGLSSDSLGLKFLKLRNWIRNKSELYTLLGRSTRNLREKVNLARNKSERIEKIKEWSKESGNLALSIDISPIETLVSPLYRLETVDLNNPNTQEGWRIARELFKKMNISAKGDKSDFIITLIPTKERVYGEYLMSKKITIPDALKDFVEKERTLAKEFSLFCHFEKIKCHDTTQDLANALLQNEIIYPHTTDGHPVAKGYEFIAKSIFSFISK